MADRICVLKTGKIAQLGTPADLYFRPASKYVADFLGESNFIPAQVREVGPIIRLRGPEGVAVEAQPCDGLSSGDQVTIMVRPESFRLSQTGESTNRFRGTVEDVIFAGGTTTFIVKIAGDLIIRVRMLTNETVFHKPGSDIAVSFEADAAKVFSVDA